MKPLVLLTGASGFVGSHVAAAFVQAGYALRCGLRPSSSRRWLAGLDFETVLLDLQNLNSVARACEGVDLVVHAAGVTRAKDEATFYRVNTEGTLNLAGAAQRKGVSRFIFVSSLEARGPDGSRGPDSPYGQSKLAAESGLRALADGPPSDILEVVVLRPAGVYGPRDTDLLPLFKLAQVGFLPAPAGNGVLQPVHAFDVATAVLAAAARPARFGPFPIAEPRSYTWPEVGQGLEAALGRKVKTVKVPAGVFLAAGYGLETVAKLLGRAPQIDARRARALAVHTYTCDVAETQREFAWQPQYPLDKGLAQTARWYELEGWL